MGRAPLRPNTQHRPLDIAVIHPLMQPMPVLGLLGALLVSAAAFGSAAGVSKQRPGRPKAAAKAPAAASSGPKTPVRSAPDVPLLIWTGEQNGHLEPCGCSKPQLGGMLRRAGYLSSTA